MGRPVWSGIGKVVLAGFFGMLACRGNRTAESPVPQDGGDSTGGTGPVVDGAADVAATEAGNGNAPDVARDRGTPQGGSAGTGGTSGTGGTNGTGGSGAGGNGGEGDPFSGVTVKPDLATTPVPDCAGQPDMTLCNVVTSPDRWYDVCVGGVCVSPGCGEISCNVPAPHFSIPANSNHTHLQVQAGAQPIVIDLVTGLHWQGCDAGRSGDSCATGTSQPMTWPEALAYCDGLTWGGKDDWYLPDHYELVSIDDWARLSDGYSLDPVAFPHPSNWYWSTHLSSASRIYAIQYRASASIVIYDRPTPGFEVRCVRRGFSRSANYTTERFTKGGVTISDAATGLMWQRCASGRSGTPTCTYDLSPTAYSASDAIAYCDAVVAGGFSDWRLPTYKELHSVLEFPPKTGSEPNPKIVSIDAQRPFLLCRDSWQSDARVLLFSVNGGDPVIPAATSTYDIICVRGN